MVTLRIVLKEFVEQLRDWKANGLMLLFPILLISILGVALGGTFGGMSSIPKVHVLYSVETDGPLATAFAGLVRQVAGQGVTFTRATSREAGLQAVRNADGAAYLVVRDRGIELAANDRYPVEAGIVRSILAAFLLRYNASAVIHALPGGAANGQVASPPAGAPGTAAFVRERSTAAGRSPSATDYYAVTMLTLIILYSSLIGARRVRTEQRLGTANRILCAPVGRVRYLSGKVIGLLLTLLVQMALLLAFSHYVLGAYWGSHLGTVFLIILAESLMIVSLGVAVAYLLPSEAATAAVLNVVIPVFAFFSGTYVPMELMGPAATLGDYSPLKWVNEALFGVIYQGDFSAVAHAVLLNLAVAVAFIAIAAFLARREATR